jgi:hypothetical protein
MRTALQLAVESMEEYQAQLNSLGALTDPIYDVLTGSKKK